MSEGPIQYVSDGPKDDKGPTEFGGRAGLIQGGKVAGEVHELDGSEKRGILVRARAATKVNALTGLVEPDESAPAVDPATGATVDPAWNEDGSSGKPVDVPPVTGDPRAGTL